ncbi:UNVERIFIED_CONTAM: hypothetical protein Slati_4240500 [Sesamum latifolium]|uniref:Uncharacterized protein n=1 Tax=Sesamum latifolium TaxID=2727402 RepID=A0AAW2TEK3_9LAMI
MGQKVENKIFKEGRVHHQFFSPQAGSSLSFGPLDTARGTPLVMLAEVSGGTSEESPLGAGGTPSSLASCPPSSRMSPTTESVDTTGGGPLTSASTSPRRLSNSSSAKKE